MGGECVADAADAVPERVLGPFSSLAQLAFELGEGHFDGIEVGGVGREEHQAGSGCFDQGGDFGAFVAGEVVHDDDIAGPQLGHEEPGDIGSEDFAVHRFVDNEGGDNAFGGQAGDEGGDLPVTAGRVTSDPLALGAPAVAPHHVGRHAGLVDEDQPSGGEPRLHRLPVEARLDEVRPQLLGGEQAFF